MRNKSLNHTVTLELCPFCNGTATLNSVDNLETIYVVCMDCGSRTIENRDLDYVVTLWNQRVGDGNG